MFGLSTYSIRGDNNYDHYAGVKLNHSILIIEKKGQVRGRTWKGAFLFNTMKVFILIVQKLQSLGDFFFIWSILLVNL